MMLNYLEQMDQLKGEYFENLESTAIKYPFFQFHYYEKIEYIVAEGVRFNQEIYAVKLTNTTILLVDPSTGIKLYLSDKDIAEMIDRLNFQPLKSHIISSLQSIVSGSKLSTLSFLIKNKTFKIRGIPFDAQYNEIVCENPAGNNINGNDFIGLINLILEKERTDKNKNKIKQTARMYIGENNS